MSFKIKVEKFVSGDLDSSFGVPPAFLSLIIQLLPEAGASELQQRGVDLRAIGNAVEQEVPYTSSFEVSENGVQKTIVISVS